MDASAERRSDRHPGDGAPALDELLDGVAVVALPLRVRFRGLDVREALLLRGPAGWGEFSPFAEYDDAVAATWLAAGVEAAWRGWPAPLRPRVAVNATVPAVPAERVPEVLARFPGCTTAKVKVAEPGQQLRDDVARVAAVREVLAARGAGTGAGTAVRVDANGGWSVDGATAALEALAAGGPLQYAEQPCASVPELVELRRRLRAAGVEVPVAADESIRRAEDPLAVVRAGAADVAVLKVPPMGGVRAVLALAAQLREEHGVPVVLSSALDTAVGIGAGLAAAAALPAALPAAPPSALPSGWPGAGEPLAAGLGTGSLLAVDVAAPRPLEDGSLPVGAVEPYPELLDRHAAPPERRRWWLDRLRRCHALLP